MASFCQSHLLRLGIMEVTDFKRVTELSVGQEMFLRAHPPKEGSG